MINQNEIYPQILEDRQMEEERLNNVISIGKNEKEDLFLPATPQKIPPSST